MFTTQEVMHSPYNYHWYVPESAHNLWFFGDWVVAAFVWEGKHGIYDCPIYTPWWDAKKLADRETSLAPLREVARKRYAKKLAPAVARRTAFVMGSHPRLGAMSLVNSLDPHLLCKVVSNLFDV